MYTFFETGRVCESIERDKKIMALKTYDISLRYTDAYNYTYTRVSFTATVTEKSPHGFFFFFFYP